MTEEPMTDEHAMTAEAYEALQAELDLLEGEGRRAIAERIKTAREWGDLKENSEYHDAKNDQAHHETKIARMRERIMTARIVERPASSAAVTFGSTVVVRDEAGKELRWELVAAHTAAPAEGKISVASPVARALIGRGVGDNVTVALPRGQRKFTVLSVE